MGSQDVSNDVGLASLSYFGGPGMASSVLAVVLVSVFLLGFMVWEGRVK